ncbi:ketosteroid isomerase-related protein [Sediminicoccus sp. KRV36]|uniref:ketosteroid isomerase-related protein n=1 Tax=Sediminicoccus sp. KRV36 TaxID=3133721 RepID=UPI00200C5FCA|nr:ketosteroid isomerase-related protein [Sediminicoccus rosea]UPY36803.1 nuclear transport factor 2 family protein [Sediminicoccus rosea]
MSDALLRRYYAAFNAADWPAMLDCLTEDVAHDINQGGREIGRPAFAAFLQRMERCYRERVADLVVMVSADGTRGAAEFTIHGTYLVADEGLPPAHGQAYTLPVGAFFELRAGRIARVTNYYNLTDWLRQVGG